MDGCKKVFAREADLKRHQRTTKTHSVPGLYVSLLVHLCAANLQIAHIAWDRVASARSVMRPSLECVIILDGCECVDACMLILVIHPRPMRFADIKNRDTTAS